jgi:hypothetical protein
VARADPRHRQGHRLAAEGKFADVLVCDRSLFASDSRVLLVLSKGHTEFEAK